MSIKIVEPEIPSEFTGKVESVSKEEGKYGPQFHVTVEPSDVDWKQIHTWISIGKGSGEEKVQRGSSLHEWVRRLNKMGLDGDNLTELFNQMENKKFKFKQERIGHSAKDKWVVAELMGD